MAFTLYGVHARDERFQLSLTRVQSCSHSIKCECMRRPVSAIADSRSEISSHLLSAVKSDVRFHQIDVSRPDLLSLFVVCQLVTNGFGFRCLAFRAAVTLSSVSVHDERFQLTLTRVSEWISLFGVLQQNYFHSKLV